jgi:hypothetical protein
VRYEIVCVPTQPLPICFAFSGGGLRPGSLIGACFFGGSFTGACFLPFAFVMTASLSPVL